MNGGIGLALGKKASGRIFDPDATVGDTSVCALSVSLKRGTSILGCDGGCCFHVNTLTSISNINAMQRGCTPMMIVGLWFVTRKSILLSNEASFFVRALGVEP